VPRFSRSAAVWATAAAVVVGGAVLPATSSPATGGPETVTDAVALATSATRAKAGVVWVNELCKAAVPTYRTAAADKLPDDPDKILSAFSSYLQKVSSAADRTVDDIDDVRSSPFKNGDVAVSRLKSSFKTLRDSMKEARKRIDALRKLDRSKVTEAALAKALRPLRILEKTMDPLDALSRSGEVKTAFGKAKSCSELSRLSDQLNTPTPDVTAPTATTTATATVTATTTATTTAGALQAATVPTTAPTTTVLTTTVPTTTVPTTTKSASTTPAADPTTDPTSTTTSPTTTTDTTTPDTTDPAAPTS